MKTIKNIIFLSTLILFGQIGFSQDLSNEEVNELQQLKTEIEGTYQIQMIDTRALPTIHISVFNEIEDLRDDTEIVYYQYSENTRILILPRSVIESSDFIKLEYYIFINSNQIVE